MEKPLVAQRRQNLPLGDEYGALHFSLVPRFFYASGNDHRAVMFGHLLVTAVQQRFITAGTNHPGFQIIGNSYPAYPMEKGIGMTMGLNPGGQFFILESLGVGLVTGTKHRHTQMTIRNAAVLG